MDARKTLARLRSDWDECEKCELGVRRKELHGMDDIEEHRMVFGDGHPGGVMFVGDTPDKEEDPVGKPFVGQSGSLLRKVLTRIGFDMRFSYMTNLVLCRSCEPAIDQATGMPRFKRRGNKPPLPLYRDLPPLPSHIFACKPRLHEEIYLVDPVIIVAVGSLAAEHLLGHSFALTLRHGEVEEIELDGNSFVPSLTEKRNAWVRKWGPPTVAPVEKNKVRYLVLPTYDPSFVLKYIADRDPKHSIFSQFVNDLKKVKNIFDRHMQETQGVVAPAAPPEITEDEQFT
jgi:uracil-DNA glycosylase